MMIGISQTIELLLYSNYDFLIGFDFRQTDRQTVVIVELFSWLKTIDILYFHFWANIIILIVGDQRPCWPWFGQQTYYCSLNIPHNSWGGFESLSRLRFLVHQRSKLLTYSSIINNDIKIKGSVQNLGLHYVAGSACRPFSNIGSVLGLF